MWYKQLVEVLIKKYEENENLYNVRHPLYLNRAERSNTFNQICKELQEISEDITVEEIKKKVHTLRSQYIRELRKIRNNKRNGISEDDVDIKLWCFNQLEFLRPHCVITRSAPTFSHLSEIVEEDNNASALSNDPETETVFINGDNCNVERLEDADSDDFLEEKPAKRPKREKIERKTISEVDNNNEFVAFATSISCQLQKLPEEDAYNLMAEMQNLVSKIKIKNLRAQRSFSTYSNEST